MTLTLQVLHRSTHHSQPSLSMRLAKDCESETKLIAAVRSHEIFGRVRDLNTPKDTKDLSSDFSGSLSGRWLLRQPLNQRSES
jgi:hypothetical protein